MFLSPQAESPGLWIDGPMGKGFCFLTDENQQCFVASWLACFALAAISWAGAAATNNPREERPESKISGPSSLDY